MSAPRFGQWMTSIHASHNNPRKHGMFVKAGRRPRGRMNPGPFYELTDGEGDFWQSSPENLVVRQTDPEPQR